MTARVEWDTTAFERGFARATARIVGDMPQVAQVTVTDMQVTARTWAQKRSGRMAASITATVQRGQSGPIGELRARHVPGGGPPTVMEFGSRPHIIRARRARFLRFFWRGAIRYRKQVRHPGTRPYPFMRIAASEGRVTAALRRAVGIVRPGAGGGR